MLRWCYVVATWIAEGCQRPNRTSQRSSSALSKQKAWFGKCRESTRTLSAAGNEKLPPANVSLQRSTMGRLKEKKQLTHSAGTFWWYAKTLRIPNEKQHHVKIHVETQYIIPFSNDLWCPPRNSNGEKTHTKKTCCDGQKTTSTSTGQKKLIRHCNTSCMKWTALKIPILPQWNTDFSQSQWSRLTSYRRTYSPWRNVYILTIPF